MTYYIVCGLPDLSIDEMTSLVKHGKAVITTVLGFPGIDLVQRRDALMVERTLDDSLKRLDGKVGLASFVVDQASVCDAIGTAWRMSSNTPAATSIATVFARAALEAETQRIASKRSPVPAPGRNGKRDWAAAAVIAVASTSAAIALTAALTYAWARAKRQLATRRRR